MAAANTAATTATVFNNACRHRGQSSNLAAQQPKVNNTCVACLATAKEQEACLCKEAEVADQDEKMSKNDTKLTETLTRVKQLQTEKAERKTRWSTTRPIITTTTSGELQPLMLVGSLQNLLQDESFFVSNTLVSVKLFNQYSAIDEVHLKAIKKNKFKPINLVKLTTEMTMDRDKIKVLTIGSEVALEACKKDAASAKLKGLPHLIWCFLIYMSIFLHFTHNSLKESLCISMLVYVEHLWGWTGTYKFDSIRQYYFLFHSLYIQKGIDDGPPWEKINENMKSQMLKVKPAQPEYTSASKQFNTGIYSGQGQTASSSQTPVVLGQSNHFLPMCH